MTEQQQEQEQQQQQQLEDNNSVPAGIETKQAVQNDRGINSNYTLKMKERNGEGTVLMSQQQAVKNDISIENGHSGLGSQITGTTESRNVSLNLSGAASPKGGAIDSRSNSNKMGLLHKPISTSSPEAQQAAQQVTPEKLSQLLLENGPLAIRFITKALSKEIPKFSDLSASKQRRLIMSALESGDETNSVVFAKIGWGQWSAVKVEDPTDFVKQRELTNIANSKIKDQMASDRRRSSGGAGGGGGGGTATVPVALSPTSKNPLDKSFSTPVPPLDLKATGKKAGNENDNNKSSNRESGSGKNKDAASTATFLDENVLVSDDDDDDHRYYDDDDDEDELTSYGLNQDVFRRRQSSVISDNNNSPPNELEFVVRTKLKNGSRSGSRSIHRQRQPQASNKRRSSSVNKPYRSSLSSLNHSNGSETLLSDPSLRRMSTHSDNRTKSIVHLSGSETDNEIISHITSSRRESRLSFTNESSIRSTLIPHLRKMNQSQEQVINDNDMDIHSDTDEEDWQAIGAETLRKHGSSPPSASPRDQDAAIALMSLKS